MGNRAVIILNDKSNIKKMLAYQHRARIITLSSDVSVVLKSLNIEHTILQTDYKQEIGEKWIKNLARKKFSRNQDLRSIFKFESTSLWWWMEYWLYSSYAYYDSFEEIIKMVHTILSLVKKENPKRLIYIRDGSLLSRSLDLIAPQIGLKTLGINNSFQIVNKKIKKFGKIKAIKFFIDSRFQFRRKVLPLFFSLNQYKILNPNSKIALFIYGLNPKQKKYIQPIIQELDNNKYNKIAVDIACGTIFFNYKSLKDKFYDSSFKNILLESYLKRSDIHQIGAQIQKFKAIKNKLYKLSKFKKLFAFKDLNLWPLFKPQLSCYFNLRLNQHLTEFFAIHNIINNLHPNVSITPTETTEFDKGLFLACQKNNTPCIAIQHGIMNDLKVIHEKDELNLKNIHHNLCPIPTVTAVFGPKDKKFLLGYGNYPKKSVIVTGNPRDEKIFHKKHNKRKICAALGLDPTKKIVTFATDNLPNKKDRILLIKSMSKVMQDINAQLVIKVHPSESLKFNKRLCKKLKIRCIVTKHNVIETLFISDILILFCSTIGLEAIILKKPLIVFNTIPPQIYVDYIDSKVAFEAKDCKELKRCILDIFHNKRHILYKNQKKYIFSRCYKVDEQAASRVARLANRLSK